MLQKCPSLTNFCPFVVVILTISIITMVIVVISIAVVMISISRFNFEPLPSIAKSGKVEGNALAEKITGRIHQNIIFIKLLPL